jgi:alkyl hydroperoxide reductase subunit F
MLDSTIKSQLQSVFANLTGSIELVVDRSEHVQHPSLLEMLNDLAATSAALSVKDSGLAAAVPTFRIERAGKPTGVQFKGIPGGHEFTSLVVAMLNAGGLGKLPDSGITQRIQKLPAGLKIRTYISLSCENCPDVVQALNQIALIHGNVEHSMIDGGLVQDELESLKIQGVPSVFVGDEMIHSGRSNLAELLNKLEVKFGATTQAGPIDLGWFDVAVIGGGPAGTSAAIYSVRKGLKTAIIAERLGGQLQETKGIENMISVPYTEGVKLSANLESHMRTYPVQILEHRRVQKVTEIAPNRHQIHLDSGEFLTTDSLVVATGAKWRELKIPGEKEYLGRGVAFCPHCDGPYYKDKRVAVVGGGNSGVEAAIDLSGICSQVTLVEFSDQLKADDVLVKKMRSISNIQVIVNARSTSVDGDGQKVTSLTYEDRATKATHQIKLDGVFVQIGLSPNSAVVKDLVETTQYGEIVVDAKGRTSRPGVYAAGDVTTVPFKQIVIAMGEGAKVALTAFEDRMRRGTDAERKPA